jgi:hypothetical protein
MPDTYPARTDVEIATGTRRDEVHYEDAPRQKLRASHLFKPAEALPRDTPAGPPPPGASSPPVEDVASLKESPSVWEARMPDDEADPDQRG